MDWQAPPKKIGLEAHTLHLWKARLPLTDPFGEYLATLLSPDEELRAKRFYFPKDRHRFTQFRGFLRYLLGQYLQETPEKIVLEENAQGKPRIRSVGKNVIYFNLSHSGDMGLFAFSLVGELGVDVEKIQDPYDGEKLAGRYFSPQETAYLTSVSQGEKARIFFRLWTLKEAYLKALGLGFSGGLDTFTMQIKEDLGTAALLGRHPEDSQDAWSLRYFEVDKEFVGALSAPKGVEEIRYFDGNQIQVYKPY